MVAKDARGGRVVRGRRQTLVVAVVGSRLEPGDGVGGGAGGGGGRVGGGGARVFVRVGAIRRLAGASDLPDDLPYVRADAEERREVEVVLPRRLLVRVVLVVVPSSADVVPSPDDGNLPRASGSIIRVARPLPRLLRDVGGVQRRSRRDLPPTNARVQELEHLVKRARGDVGLVERGVVRRVIVGVNA